MKLKSNKLRCRVTRYHANVDGIGISETEANEVTTCFLTNGYLYLGISAATARADSLLAGARAGGGWLAQYGTKPYFDNGHLTGKDHPNIYVTADALLEVLDD